MATVLARCAAAGVLAAVLATPAGAAARFTKVVAFGDSYADIGNVQAILANAGLSALYPQAEYPTGRFSGGTNFVDTIADAYGVAQDNYAIGGAQAGTGNVAAQGLLPGFRQQWVAFTQGGTTYTDTGVSIPITVSGVRTAIPAGGLRFGAEDLAVFSVGGNDARPYRRTGTLAGAPAAADAAAAQATEGLDALVARGIRHMVFTAGDVGRLAEAVGQANAPVGSAFSAEYNARMQAALARYAAAGVQVAYVDITRVNDVVKADPARFGFADVVHACPAACEGDPALQSRYFFYDDGVHLTSAAFTLVGRYAVNQLDAPYGFRADGDVVLRAAEGLGQAAGARLDLARGGRGRDGLAVFGSFTAARDRFRADATSDGYRYTSRGGQGGVEFGAGPVLAGVLFATARGRADGPGDDAARARSYQLAGYAVADAGPVFAQAYAGAGWHRVAVRRTGVADPLTADPHGRSTVAGARAGWLGAPGPLRVGPTLAIDYVHARLNGYAEGDDPAAALIVGRQVMDTVTGSAGLEARGQLPGFAPWLRVAAAKALAGDGRTVRYAPAAAPGIGDAFAIAAGSHGLYGTVAGGLSATLAGAVSIEAAAQATVSRRTGNAVGGQVGLSARL